MLSRASERLILAPFQYLCYLLTKEAFMVMIMSRMMTGLLIDMLIDCVASYLLKDNSRLYIP